MLLESNFTCIFTKNTRNFDKLMATIQRTKGGMAQVANTPLLAGTDGTDDIEVIRSKVKVTEDSFKTMYMTVF